MIWNQARVEALAAVQNLRTTGGPLKGGRSFFEMQPVRHCQTLEIFEDCCTQTP